MSEFKRWDAYDDLKRERIGSAYTMAFSRRRLSLDCVLQVKHMYIRNIRYKFERVVLKVEDVYEKSLRLMQEHLDTVDSQDFIEDHRRIEAKIARRNRQ